MQVLHKGECEHCHQQYNFSLWNAQLGECSYAYCDSCGMVATIDYRDRRMALLPPTDILNQEMDASWESHLAPCACGGQFQRGASPRCPVCRQPLSAEKAAPYIEAMQSHVARNWRWQGNWSDEYFVAIEDPQIAGEVRQVANPFPGSDSKKSKKRWFSFLSSDE